MAEEFIQYKWVKHGRDWEGPCYPRETNYSILFYPIILEGRRGSTDEFATIPFHLFLFSAALVGLGKSISVHCLILSFQSFSVYLFFLPFTVPCRAGFALSVTKLL